MACWRLSSRNCSWMYRLAALTPFSTICPARCTKLLRTFVSSRPELLETDDRLEKPVYCTESTSPVSPHIRRSVACKDESTELSSSEERSSASSASCVAADCSASHVCAMFVRLRQSKQFVRTIPFCSRSGVGLPTEMAKWPCAAASLPTAAISARAPSAFEARALAWKSKAHSRTESGSCASAASARMQRTNAAARSASSPFCSRRLRRMGVPYAWSSEARCTRRAGSVSSSSRMTRGFGVSCLPRCSQKTGTDPRA
mmetsp:Transcript_47345/g.117225  ORF Transcript_47345/g.117225 Transcript_47345/m.117225 type:complete len:258 (-) Transcript_47345:823-1596(-)